MATENLNSVEMGSEKNDRADACLDLRRQAAITKGGPSDHVGEAVVVVNDKFTLDGTIFENLEGVLQRHVMKKDLGVVPYWTDVAVQRISLAFSKIERPPRIDKCLEDFMLNECNFNMEHAEGSFMDHLSFCYEYSAVNFKQHSPRVLLLHSILGVGTNFFPMGVDKIPMLEAMLTPEEMKHIEAFPSILRIMTTWELIDELNDRFPVLDKLESIDFHRVIDNKKLQLTAEEFWVHMNYQMVHLLDFLPTADWRDLTMPVCQVCLGLHDLLTRAGQMQARVEMDKITSIGFISVVKKRLGARAIRNYSSKIGHDLSYTLNFAANSNL